MIPALKDQALDIRDGVLQSVPKCPVCKEKDAFIYSEVREQFVCGPCFYKDYQKLQAEEQKHKVYLRGLLTTPA